MNTQDTTPCAQPVPELSIGAALAGKRLLVTGTSGFVGKVWLAVLLDRVPAVGRVFVLLRPGKDPGLSPHQRFEQMVAHSYCFKPLHERYGTLLPRFLAERVEVVEGDVGAPGLGMAPDVASRLRRELDVVVNVAGLVDFDADLREAHASNVSGAVNCVDFAAECDHACLAHVSTCYVAGNCSGTCEERVVVGYRPDGGAFDPEAEYADVARFILELQASADLEARDQPPEKRERFIARKFRRAGMERSLGYGWPNTYTWSKSLAEQLIKMRAEARGLAWTIVRPSVVECAVRFPFPGWNEGLNTCAPVAYLLGSWMRHLPAKASMPFDIIPVDECCNGLMIATAAVVTRTHHEVYHCATSVRNPVTVDRIVELTALSHRRHLRTHGHFTLAKKVSASLEAVVGSPRHPLAPRNLHKVSGALARAGNGFVRVLPAGLRPLGEAAAGRIRGVDRLIGLAASMVDLYRPFIYDNRQVFPSHALASHRVVEPEFRFAPELIDWRHYWTEIEMPGLHRWCFPLFKREQPEKYDPGYTFQIPGPNAIAGS